MNTKDREFSEHNNNFGSVSGYNASSFKQNSIEILFCKGDILLKGSSQTPFSMITTPDFQLNLLPVEFRKNISSLKSLTFNNGFNSGKIFNETYSTTPSWLSKLKELKLLDLRFFEIDNLTTIKKLPIKYLLLSNVSLTNRNNFVDDLKKMHHLRYIVQNKILTSAEILQIKSVNPTLSVISWRDYTKMIIENKLDLTP